MHVWASLFAIATSHEYVLDADDMSVYPPRAHEVVHSPQPIVVTWSALQPLGGILKQRPRQSISFGAFRQLNAATRERICAITADALAKGPQFQHKALTSCLDPLSDALGPSWLLSRVVDACDALVDYLAYDTLALGLSKSCQDVAAAPVMEYHVCLQTLQTVLQVAPRTAQHRPTALNAVDVCSEVAQFPLDVQWCKELDQALELEMNAKVHVTNHGAFCKDFVNQESGTEPILPRHEVHASTMSQSGTQASVVHAVQPHDMTRQDTVHDDEGTRRTRARTGQRRDASNQSAAHDDHQLTQLPLAEARAHDDHPHAQLPMTQAHTATFAVAHEHAATDMASGNAPSAQQSPKAHADSSVAQNVPSTSAVVRRNNLPLMSPVTVTDAADALRYQNNVLAGTTEDTSLHSVAGKATASVDATNDSVSDSSDDARALQFVLTSASWASTCARTLAHGALQQEPTDFPLGGIRNVLRTCARAMDTEESLAYSLCDDVVAKFTERRAHAPTTNVTAFCETYGATVLASLQHNAKQRSTAKKATTKAHQRSKEIIMTKMERETRDALEKRLKDDLQRDLVSEDKSALRRRLQSRTKNAAARFVDQVRAVQRAPSIFLRNAVLRNEKNVGAAIWELGQPSAAHVSRTSLSTAALNSKMQSSGVTGNDAIVDDGSLWKM